MCLRGALRWWLTSVQVVQRSLRVRAAGSMWGRLPVVLSRRRGGRSKNWPSGPAREVRDGGVRDGRGVVVLTDREHAITRILGDNLYFFGGMRERVTFADVYFDDVGLARVCIRCMNARRVVLPVFRRFCGDAAGQCCNSVLRFVFSGFPAFDIPEVGCRFLAHFVMQCSRIGVTKEEYDLAVEAASARRESALNTAIGRRQEDDAKKLLARQRRDQGGAAVARRRRL